MNRIVLGISPLQVCKQYEIIIYIMNRLFIIAMVAFIIIIHSINYFLKIFNYLFAISVVQMSISQSVSKCYVQCSLM